MKLRTTLLLLALLAGLAAVVRWQLRVEDSGGVDVDVRLFEDVDVSAVRTIRIDNIERSLNLRLERDSRGEWYITDPIVYPARRSVVRLLLEDIAAAKAMVVPEEEWGEEELGFAPPKVVLEVEETTEEAVDLHRVEIGANDLDGMTVNVRVEGRYLRALRRLYTTLNRDLHEFRSARAMSIPVKNVVEVRRTGSVLYEVGGTPRDLTTIAYRVGGTWRSTVPYDALLDPLDAGVLVVGAGGLEVDRFIEDEPVDLSVYAMDRPLVEILLRTEAGDEETLLVSRVGNRSLWFVMRKGEPHVWAIDPEKASLILTPYAGMLERHFMRGSRRDVTALVLSRPGSEIRLERGPSSWTVAEKREGGEWSVAAVADPAVAEDVLARLESLEVSGFFVDEAPPPTGWERGVRVELGSAAYAGRLGERFTDESGEPGVLFQREGDEVVGWIDSWLAELADTSFDALRSTDLLSLEEIEISGLTLTRGAETLVYERSNRGIWRPEGEEREALEILPLLDSLIFLRAGEHLDTSTAFTDPIEVQFRRFEGGTVSFTVGLGETGEGPTRAEIRIGDARSTARAADLHAGLAGLFGS